MKISKIKQKITKLLALSASPNEAEAAAALAKANELLSRHGLDAGDLIDGESPVSESLLDTAESLLPWEERLVACISKATYTDVIKLYGNKPLSLKIIGRRANVITAKILYEYLHEAVGRKARLFESSIDDIPSFCIGMVDSIRQRLNDMLKSAPEGSRELVPVLEKTRTDENMKYIEKTYGKPGSGGNEYIADPNSYGLGKSVGKTIPVTGQIPAGYKKN